MITPEQEADGPNPDLRALLGQLGELQHKLERAEAKLAAKTAEAEAASMVVKEVSQTWKQEVAGLNAKLAALASRGGEDRSRG